MGIYGHKSRIWGGVWGEKTKWQKECKMATGLINANSQRKKNYLREKG